MFHIYKIDKRLQFVKHKKLRFLLLFMERDSPTLAHIVGIPPKPLSARLTLEQIAALDEMRKQEKCNRSEMLRRLTAFALEHYQTVQPGGLSMEQQKAILREMIQEEMGKLGISAMLDSKKKVIGNP